MTQVLQEQRDSREEAKAAREAAKAPKTVNDYFKDHLTEKLMILCRVADEGGLPELWSEVAAANGKRDQEAIELVVRQTANSLGLSGLAPVITPGLAKKITTLRSAGSDLDDLEEGVNPFSMVIMDHTTVKGERTYNEALAAAHDYDDLLRGSGTAGLNDLKEIKGTSAVIPDTFNLARATLQAHKILLLRLLGDTHSQHIQHSQFVTKFINRENFYVGRIQRVDAALGPARFLRCVHLVLRAWSQSTWEAGDLAAARAIPNAALTDCLMKMSIGDMSWLPEIPDQYIRKQAKKTAASAAGGEATRRAQILSPSKNQRFNDFRTGITTIKFKEDDPKRVTLKITSVHCITSRAHNFEVSHLEISLSPPLPPKAKR